MFDIVSSVFIFKANFFCINKGVSVMNSVAKVVANTKLAHVEADTRHEVTELFFHVSRK